MIVACNQCKTRFNLDDGVVKESGSKVRCSKCNAVFTVFPSSDLSDATPLTTKLPPEPAVQPKSPGARAGGVPLVQEDDLQTTRLDDSLEDQDLDDMMDILASTGDDDLSDQFNELDNDVDAVTVDMLLESDFVEEEPVVQKKEDKAAEALLENLELEIEGEAESSVIEKDVAPETEGDPLDAGDDLDLSDLNNFLDLGGEDADSSLDAAIETEIDQTLDAQLQDLDMEMDLEEDAAVTGAASPPDDSDLGLSDIEKLLDMDDKTIEQMLEIEGDTDLDAPQEAAAAPGADEIPDLEIELEPEAPEEKIEEAAAPADIDLSELDEMLDIEPDEEAAAAPGADEVPDLEIELEPEAPEEKIEEAAAPADVDLSELDEMLDIEPDEEAAAAPGADEIPDLEIELEPEAPEGVEIPDLGLGLAPDPPEEAMEEALASEDIDLADLDAALDIEPGDEAAEPVTEDLPDMDLSLELEKTESELEEVMADDDIDLPELDAALDIEPEGDIDIEAEPELAPSDGEEEKSDLELALAEETDVESADGADADQDEEELDLVELEEIIDFEEDTAEEELALQGKGLGLSAEAEKDLSEIESLLEIDETEKAEGFELEEVDEEDLEDLELDLTEIESELGLDHEAEKTEDSQLELEFETDTEAGDVELTADDITDDIEDLEDLEIDLEMDLDGEATPVEKEVAAEEESELDLDGIGDFEIEIEDTEIEEDVVADADSAGATDKVEAPSLEEVNAGETPAEQKVQTAPEEPVEAFAMSDEKPAPVFTDKFEAPKPVPSMMAPPRRKKGVSIPLVILLLLIIAGGGIFALNQAGIKIPYLDPYIEKVTTQAEGLIARIPYIGTKEKAPADVKGILRMRTENINSKFVDNPNTGKLFVVTGDIKSAYTEPRRNIKIEGSLFVQGKQLAKMETVYVGNVISDIELSSLDQDAIKAKLADSAADPAALTVKPGGTLPFMVVFANLPANLEEFTIEVTESSPVNK
jgi:predicted Zn finger-like uncharacterized protein